MSSKADDAFGGVTSPTLISGGHEFGACDDDDDDAIELSGSGSIHHVSRKSSNLTLSVYNLPHT